MPTDRIRILRDGYAKMLADSDFLAEAKKREWDVEYISGEDLESTARKAVNQTPDTIARLKKILAD